MQGRGLPHPPSHRDKASHSTLLTVSVLLEPRQLVGAYKNVGLAMEAVPKGMLPVGQDVVEDAASGEDVHPTSLQERREAMARSSSEISILPFLWPSISPGGRSGEVPKVPRDFPLLDPRKSRAVNWTHGALLRVLPEHLGRDPPLRARNARAETEALVPPLQLLAQAEVGDDGSEAPLPVRDRDQNVAGLQVPMSWREKGPQHKPGEQTPGFCLKGRGRQRPLLWGWCLTYAEGVQMCQSGHGLGQQGEWIQAFSREDGALHVLEGAEGKRAGQSLPGAPSIKSVLHSPHPAMQEQPLVLTALKNLPSPPMADGLFSDKL